MSVVRRAALVAVAVLLAPAALAACTSDGDDGSTAAPAPLVTDLADLATEDLAVVRGGFCDRVSPRAVEDALGGEPSDAAAWGNGERTRLAKGLRDVVHEYGCAWKGPEKGDRASAWVFAPPVTGREARRLGRDAARADGCERLDDAERFGSRSVAVTCEAGGRDGATSTTYLGLFGDAWLSCSLSGGDRERTARWCAAVVQAAAAA